MGLGSRDRTTPAISVTLCTEVEKASQDYRVQNSIITRQGIRKRIQLIVVVSVWASLLTLTREALIRLRRQERIWKHKAERLMNNVV